MEQLFREFKFELPSSNISKVVVTPELISNPKKALQKLLKKPTLFNQDYYDIQFQEFETQLQHHYKAKVILGPEVRKQIIFKHETLKTPINTLCNERIQPLIKGLQRITEEDHNKQLIISSTLLKETEQQMEAWIKQQLDEQK